MASKLWPSQLTDNKSNPTEILSLATSNHRVVVISMHMMANIDSLFL